MRFKLSKPIFFIVIVVIALIQVACEVPRPGSTPTPEIVAICTSVNVDVNLERPYPLPGEPYVPGEIIITGEALDIARVLAEIPEFAEVRVQGACGSVVIEVQNAQQEATGRLPVLTGGLETRLYPLPPGMTPWQAIELIYVAVWNLVEENPDDPPIVFADPNYILGYDVEGDPSNGHSGIGATSVGALAALPPLQGSAQEAAFWNQWALGPAERGGIDIASGRGARNPDLPTGGDTTIVLFDTSPYPAGSQTVDWVTPPLQLEVVTPVPVPANAPNLDPNLNQHGLYAAGLAHAVAPDSQKILVRVLNDTAQGDLFSLLRAVGVITESQLANGNTDNLVYNFSLGVTPRIDEVNPPAEALTHIRDLIAREIPAYSEMLGDGSLEAGIMPIAALRKTFLDLYALGITAVGAAGNDSDLTTGLPTQRPAAYPEVIAVAANDITSSPACYSNIGQLAAPGGAGGTDPGSCNSSDVAMYCHDNDVDESPGCDLALISVVTQTRNGTPNGYAYWIGTSFSAPLVSGLSALLIAESPNPLLPEDVAMLVNSATPAGSCALLPIPGPGTTNRLGTGIVSVPQALNNLSGGGCP